MLRAKKLQAHTLIHLSVQIHRLVRSLCYFFFCFVLFHFEYIFIRFKNAICVCAMSVQMCFFLYPFLWPLLYYIWIFNTPIVCNLVFFYYFLCFGYQFTKWNFIQSIAIGIDTDSDWNVIAFLLFLWLMILQTRWLLFIPDILYTLAMFYF